MMIIIMINSFVHLKRIALISFYKVTWNTLTKQFIIKPTSKRRQILQDVTYGENLVKDNSIAPSAKRRRNIRNVED